MSDADGSKARDLSQLSGLNVGSVAWTPDGRIVFTALGRSSQVHSGSGPIVALTAMLLQGILLAGGVLLLVRRWNVPLGALTLMLTFFALSMAVQTDLYVYAIAGFLTGLAADIAVAVLRDRIRGGRFFYVLGFAVPALFTSLYLIITVQGAGGQSELGVELAPRRADACGFGGIVLSVLLRLAARSGDRVYGLSRDAAIFPDGSSQIINVASPVGNASGIRSASTASRRDRLRHTSTSGAPSDVTLAATLASKSGVNAAANDGVSRAEVDVPGRQPDQYFCASAVTAGSCGGFGPRRRNHRFEQRARQCSRERRARPISSAFVSTTMPMPSSGKSALVP